MIQLEKRVHSFNKHVRLTPEENAILSEKAADAGMSDSSYLRLMITQKPNSYPEIRLMLKELINEINHIGVNVNQIVKNHNSGFYSTDDKNRLIAYMRKLNQTVDEAVKQIGSK